jgi:predicted aspartyl protease
MKRLAALGWLCAAAHAQAQSVPPPAILPVAPAGQNIPTATDASARISVPVAIGGQVWHFLIDTASTRTVIASDVADRLALAPGHPLHILTIAGTESVPSVVIPELGFAAFAVSDIHAPSLARANLGGDGLLGLDILRDNRVAIDFRHGTALTIAPSSRQQPPPASHGDPDTIVVVARSRMGELIVTNADIDGIPVAVILDTGAQDSIGNPALARMLAIYSSRNAARAPRGPATLLSVTGRSLPADYALIGALHIGGVAIDNVPMAFGDLATFRQFNLVRRPAILLGMQTLRLFARVTIDFPRRQIRFLLRRNLIERDPL